MHLRAVHGVGAHVLSPSYIHSPKLYTQVFQRSTQTGRGDLPRKQGIKGKQIPSGRSELSGVGIEQHINF